MKIVVDTDRGRITLGDGAEERSLDLWSREGFEALSELWLKVGWNQKYTYTFSWMGRPVIQLPDDMIRVQEVLYALRPDVVVETGVAHGGSLVFYASLFEAMGKGRVVGVDVEIRPHNRRAIEAHELFSRITLVEGNSVAPEIVAKVESLLSAGETVLVMLDSCHTREHVRAELEAYHRFVTPGSYIVATDGIMRSVADAPRGNPAWREDNPAEAARDFLRSHDEFELAEPPWTFNESELRRSVTHWPGAWLRRTR